MKLTRASLATISLVSVLFSACTGKLERPPVEVTSSGLRIGTPGKAIWAAPIILPLVPAAAASLPNGKVMFWSADSRTSFGGSGSTYTAFLDPVTKETSELLVTATGHDMFCPGTTNLADGRILVNGGIDSGKTSIYDVGLGGWVKGPVMNIPRGYNANTLLWDESVFTLGGSWSGGSGNKHAEVWSETGGWKRLTGVPVTSAVTADPNGIYRADNHMWLVPVGNGRVLHVGPSVHMNWIDTAGNGAISPAGDRGDDVDSMSGNAVMYDAGKILKVGGSTAYNDVEANSNAYVIDTNGGLNVRKLKPMAYARAFHNSVVLPNGQVVVVGGQTRPVPFSDDRSVLAAELWDPNTEEFTTLPAMAVPRNYHSVALLLPDGTVISAGGGLCGGCSTNHADAQVLTPPYLLNEDGTLADRPVITSAPSQVGYGSSAPVTTGSPVAAFSLVRMGSTTHTVNNDQRRIALAFQTTGENAYSLSIPTNPGIALPGVYMLFAMDASGVPSVAKTVRVVGFDTPKLIPPSSQLASLTVTTTLALSATAPFAAGPITFSATGLPAGLTLNSGTGVISGTPTAQGNFVVTVMATNSAGSVSTEFIWKVIPAGQPRFLKLEQLSALNGNPWGSMAELNLLDSSGNAIPRAGFQVTTDSEELTGENGAAINAIDGNNATIWHTQWKNANPAPPHWFVVDMAVGATTLSGIRYLPRQDGATNGNIAAFRIYLSVNGTDWGTPIAEGDFTTMGATAAEKTVLFPVVQPNRPPVLTAPADQTTAQGQTVSLPLSATDPDGDLIGFSATGLPPGLSINANSGTIEGTPTTPGTFAANVVAEDSKTANTSVAFTWTITATPTIIAPVLAPPAVVGSAASYTPDVSGPGLTFSWNFGDGTADLPFDLLSPASHTFAAAGLYTVTFSAKDLDGKITTRLFTQAVVPTAVAGRPMSSSNVMLESKTGNGGRLWVVNPDNDSVSVFAVATQTQVAEISVGANPATAAVAADGTIWVTARDAANISVIDPTTLTVSRTIALPRASQPHGIAFSGIDGSAYVTLDATGQLLKLSTAGAVIGSLSVGPRPRDLAIDATGARIFVSRFITPPLPGEATAVVQTSVGGVARGGEVVVVSTSTFAVQKTVTLKHSDAVDSTVGGRGVPNYLGAAAISPDGRSAWVPSKQDNVLRGMLRDGRNLDFQNTVRAITSRIDLTTVVEDYASRVDHDNSGVASAAAFHPTGAYLFVALETSRHLAVLNPVNHTEFLRVDVGRAPQGVAVSPDGLLLMVSNFMDRTVTVLDLVPLVNYGEARLPVLAVLGTVSTDRLPANVLRGKQFFYDARDARLARDGYMSCASCHRDAQGDGRTWDFTGVGEGLRNTISLKGRGGAHGPLHWSANFDEVQDFEGQIRAFSQGTGLMSDVDFSTGTRNTPLGDVKTGVSADLDALAAYLASRSKFAQSPLRNADGTLTTTAASGKKVFLTKCATCHGGDNFTASATGNLMDIGTIKASSGLRLGSTLTGIDIPTLRDVWATPPYLHDGSAATLTDAIKAHKAITLTSTQLTQLVAYTGQIGSEEAGLAKAVTARYVKLQELSEINGKAWGSMAEFKVVDAAGSVLSRTGWTATADSQELVGASNGVANILDGKTNTYWQTEWKAQSPLPPHHVIVDMKSSIALGGFRYQPRQTTVSDGTFARFRFFVSNDGVTWGAPIYEGDFSTMGSWKTEKTVILK
jgi:large repetitive protein